MPKNPESARKRVALAWAYGGKGKFDEALRELRKAIEEDPECADAYFIVGLIYEKRGFPDESVKMYRMAIRCKPDHALAHCNLGALYMRIGRSDDAVGELEEALRYNPHDAFAYYNLGCIYLDKWDLEAAKKEFESAVKYKQDYVDARRALQYTQQMLVDTKYALKIFDEMAYKLRQGTTTIEEIAVQLKKYKLSSSIVSCLANRVAKIMYSDPLYAHHLGSVVYEASKLCDDKWLQAMSATIVATILQNMGSYEKSIDLYESSLLTVRNEGRSPDPSMLVGLGNAYVHLGDYEKAITYYKESLKMSEDRHDTRNQSTALINLGQIYDTIYHDTKQAKQYCVKGMEICVRTGYQYGKMLSLQVAARLMIKTSQYVEAKKYCEEALRINREMGLRSAASEAETLLILGLIDQGLGNYEGARNDFLQALAIAETNNDMYYNHLTCEKLGTLFADYIGDKEQAYSWYKKAIDIVEATRALIVSEVNRISFLSSLIDLYYLMVSLCLRMSKFKDAFEYAERGKSRAFLELLESVHINLKEAGDKDLVVRAEALRLLINHLYRQLENTPKDVDARGNRNPRFEEVFKKIRDSEREEVELWDKIKSRNPEYASLRVTETISLDEVKELLDEHSALIEYYSRRGGENPIIAFLVTRSSLSCVQLDLSVINLWKMIFDRTTGRLLEPSRENVAWLSEVLGHLHDKLFSPIEHKLTEYGIQRIYFCPHGLLHLFPLHAMYKETEYGRRYIIEDYTVAYAPSASVLRHCIRKKKQKGDSLLAIKNPDGTLEYADLEVEAISKLYAKNVILDRVKGTKENVIAKAREHDIVHFACHGLFRGDIPRMSGLKLADGWFTMVDVLNNLQLDASQVILSSCQTGKSKQEGGDEVIGLTRAFLYAGAPSVIASLWSVDDESTSLLFQRYHTYQREGLDKAESLRKAQIDTMNFRKDGVIGRPFSHPYFWGPFCLIGSWGLSS